MYRLGSTWIMFFGLACILEATLSYSTDIYDEEEEGGVPSGEISYDHYPKNFPDLRNLRSMQKREPGFTPYISVGALSNMQQFFENLKENLDSLENLPMEGKVALVKGKQEHTAEAETRAFRPPATAAYLHAIRNQRPSYRIRNFVANAEPPTLQGSNYYDPSYLWSGLGRRK